MANRKKFEEMLERLINEDKDGAAELFHEIVVEKSREIYRGLLESENDELDLDENFDLETFEVAGDDDMDDMEGMGGDQTDDMIDDVEDGDDMGDMEDGDDEDDSEDRIEDLEDAFAELKAEFERLMADEDGDDDMADDEDGDDDMADDEDGDDDMADDEDEAEDDDEEDTMAGPMKKSATEQMREYVEKIGGDSYDKFAKSSDVAKVKKSPVASKNDMGGTVKNIAQGGAGETKGTKGGLASPQAKPMNTKNVNVPGANGAKTMKPMTAGHGSEKKGSTETAANKKSTIGSK